jgi:hypothetical protein
MGEPPSVGWTWSKSVVAYGADRKSSTNSNWVNWSFRGKSNVLWVEDLIHLNNYNWHEMFKFAIFHINISMCPHGLNIMCISFIYFSSIICFGNLLILNNEKIFKWKKKGLISFYSYSTKALRLYQINSHWNFWLVMKKKMWIEVKLQ